MTSLADQLRERIKAEGPITVEAYMAVCNAHYCATRDPLGEAGDFTTAPEISQMFGELVGACLADCWRRAGEPPEAVYAELGPGRGTLRQGVGGGPRRPHRQDAMSYTLVFTEQYDRRAARGCMNT